MCVWVCLTKCCGVHFYIQKVHIVILRTKLGAAFRVGTPTDPAFLWRVNKNLYALFLQYCMSRNIYMSIYFCDEKPFFATRNLFLRSWCTVSRSVYFFICIYTVCTFFATRNLYALFLSLYVNILSFFVRARRLSKYVCV